MSNDKIKITKKEFDELYELEITGETEADDTGTSAPDIMPDKQNTTPEFLTEEEQSLDDTMHSQYEEYEVET